jgi:hypothetical protein
MSCLPSRADARNSQPPIFRIRLIRTPGLRSSEQIIDLETFLPLFDGHSGRETGGVEMTGNFNDDFDRINREAPKSIRLWLWDFPGGRLQGLEYVVRNPRCDDKRLGSFKVNIRSGLWSDFATTDAKGNDLISLVAYVRNINQGEAANCLANKIGIPPLKLNGSASYKPSTNGSQRPSAKSSAVRKIADTYDYLDENGDLIFQVVRFEPKDFRQRRPAQPADDSAMVRDGWVWEVRGLRQVPYRLPELIEAIALGHPVWIVEGEKDTNSLWKLGIPATCNAGGAGKWKNEFREFFIEADVIVAPDNDPQGQEHATAIAQSLAGTVARLRVLDLTKQWPMLPAKADVSDCIAAGATAEQLWSLADSTLDWSAPPAGTSQDQVASAPHPSEQDWRAKVVMANDLQSMSFPPVRHILPGYISEGATIIAGKPKIGKSWLTLDLCLAATANRFTLGTLKPTQGDVLYLALEDNNRRLKRRMAKLWPSLEACWPARLALVTDWKRAGDGGLEDIEDWCTSVADPVLVVVDTLEKFRPLQNGKSNAYSADYAAMTGLQKIAGRHRIAVVINHHVRKMEADDPFDTVSGTLGLTGAADTIIVLKRHAGAVTLHARGRDIEEIETALQFERATGRWTILGAAAEVYVSNERAAVLQALASGGSDGLAVSEIMAATGSNSRGAMDTLLFKMKEGGEVVRVKRGVYALPQDGGKIGQKGRRGLKILKIKS